MKNIVPLLVVSVLVLSGYSANALSNHEKQGLKQSVLAEQYDMVVIAPEMFSLNLQPLINHKNNRDVQTILKTTEDIYNEYSGRDNIEQIKYFIKDAKENWNITYVLLVGGAMLLPARYTHIYYDYYYQDEWVFLSDLYYADLYDQNGDFSSWDTNENDVFGEFNWGPQHQYDDVDLYPDVYLGRLACINQNELITCINKIISYETEQAYLQPWFNDLVVIGGDSLPGDPQQIDEGEYVNEGVITSMDGFLPKKIWASNGALNNAENIQDAINAGAGFVFFNGHGNLRTWATHPHESNEWIPPGSYTNSYLNALSNSNKLPIVVSDACYHCTYDVAPDCFGWTFVTNPNGGCIGFLGSTDVDVSYPGVDIITKGIEKLCMVMSENYMQGDLTFGELWGHGLYDYLATADMDEMDLITVEEFQPFGDPSLAIASDSQAPLPPEDLNGPTSGKINEEHIYTASTTDPEEDDIYYLFDWGDGEFSGWVGPYDSGNTGLATHIWTEEGDYEIRVKAKDDHGVQSEWSDPFPVSMPKDQSVLFNSNVCRWLIKQFPNLFPILKHLILQ